MNFYKKIISSKKLRFKILSFLSIIPDKQMLQLQYFIKHGRILNLSNPKRYTEKMQWYKLYYRNDLMPICVDKNRVREYIAQKGLSDILVKQHGAYDRVDDIDFDMLPDKFIMKTTNGSGTNYICKDKKDINAEEVKKMFQNYFEQSNSSAGREWVYNNAEKKIIIEELLEDDTQSDGAICDYKFLCFNGKPEYVVYDVDRFTEHKRNIYDTNWNNLNIASDCPCCEREIAPPENLDKMLEIAKTLCADFPAVRVDLYNIKGKIYFGELTFFPWSGYVQYKPDEFDFIMGEKFVLPKKNN